MSEGRVTVLFDDPFWIGLIEKVVAGAEQDGTQATHQGRTRGGGTAEIRPATSEEEREAQRALKIRNSEI